MSQQNQYTLPFWSATLTVSTAATTIWSLATTYFAAVRTTDAIDQSATVMFLTAEKGNGATIIYVGDKTLNAATAPPTGVGFELTAGQAAWNGQAIPGGMTTDLNQWWVQASSTATPYLCVLVLKC